MPSRRFQKPYSRSSSPEIEPCNSTASELDEPGFPTFAQYKSIENSFLAAMEETKHKEKALISLSTYDRILAVLKSPNFCRESGRFVTWALKMFALRPKSSSSQPDSNSNDVTFDNNDLVVLHDGRVVAVQEHLYQILCSCHAEHGGRDKTYKSIRQTYSFVPKRIVRSFVQACPTCRTKRRSKRNDSISSLSSEASLSSRSSSESLYTMPSSDDELGVKENLAPSFKTKPPAISKLHSSSSSSSNVSSPYSLHPMSREVSLYEGLPFEWQMRFESYEVAAAEFMKARDEIMAEQRKEDEEVLAEYKLTGKLKERRLRIPSIITPIGYDLDEPSPRLSGLSAAGFSDEDIDPSLLGMSGSSSAVSVHNKGGDN